MPVDVIEVPEAVQGRTEDVLSQFLEILPLADGGKSRLAVVRGGGTVPVLTAIAGVKFPRYDRTHFYPAWKDGDPTNETWENVGLFINLRKYGRPKTSGITAPAGTNEYQRQYYEVRKKRVKALEEAVVKLKGGGASTDPLTPEEVKSSQTLDRILSMVESTK